MKDLSPEQERALNTCLKKLHTFQIEELLSVSALQMDHISIKNSSLFIEGRITRRNLPHEEGWMWNQSKPKAKAYLNDREYITIAKYNPRKTKDSKILQQPSYKLWVCSLFTNTLKNRQIQFLWVERGKADLSSPPPLVRRAPPTSSMQLIDYSFLAQFVPKDVALEFGWLN